MKLQRLFYSLTLLIAFALPAQAQQGIGCPDPYVGNVCYGAADARDVGIVSGGTLIVRFNRDGTIVTPAGSLKLFDSALSFGTVGGSADVFLTRDAANTLAQRNGTSAQLFNTYNTYTSATNNEKLEIGVSSDSGANTFGVLTSKTGAGTVRALSLGTMGSAAMNFVINGALAWSMNTSGHLMAGTDNTFDIGASGATRPRSLYLASALRQVGGLTTVGVPGVPAVVAIGRLTAQTAAVGTVSTFTVGAADASFEVSANVLVTTATTHSFSIECAYTDEGNTARTVTMTFRLVASPATLTTLVANGNGTVPYNGDILHIRAKAATAILVRTQAAGTYTTVTYNVEGVIKQTN